MEILALILCNQDDSFEGSYVRKDSRILYPLIDKPLFLYVHDALINAKVTQYTYVMKKSSSKKILETLENKNIIFEDEIIKLNEQIKNYDIIVLIDGDRPLIQSKTICQLIDIHQKNNNDVTYQDGIYLVFKDVFLRWINNASFDFNKIDALFIKDDYRVQNCNISLDDSLKIKTRKDLLLANQRMKDRIINRHLDNGVVILSANTTFISNDAVIGNDTIIYPNTFIYGKSMVGVGCELGPNAFIVDSFIDNFIKVENCMIKNKTIKK
ncbi:MAG: hypothetical protein MR270_06570 [Erysipelotrichaceae bacterium]|nr:hypothetical protein [Erysipelotrichaceae bacterium]